MSFRSVAAIAALFLPATLARAQTYEIKLKPNPSVGKSVTVIETEKSAGSVTVSDKDGKVINKQDLATTKEEAFTESVIEQGKDDKKPSKYKRAFSKARSTAGGETKKRPVEGRIILFERKGDKYVLTPEGGPEIPKRELDELTQKANDDSDKMEEHLLPKKAVKEGDTWPINKDEITKSFGKKGKTEIDADASKATGKLVKAYKKGEQQWGTLEFTLDLKLKKFEGTTFEPPATLTATLTLDTAIDGSSSAGKLTGTVKIKGATKIEESGQTFQVALDATAEMNKEQSAEK